jgi:sec-independent protein translocase protein TatB
MIDLGLAKLALIGAVALIVIGPKDLPKVARMAGTLLGRAQRYISQVKTEVSREIEMEELRKMQKEVQTAAQDFEQSMTHEISEAEQELNTLISPDQGEAYSNTYHNTMYAVDNFAVKAKNFRRKKLAKTSNIPNWYKSRHGQRAHIISGSARMSMHRVKPNSQSSFF